MPEDLSKLKLYPQFSREVRGLIPQLEARKNTRKGSHCLNYHLSGPGKNGEAVHVYVKCGREHVFASDAKKYQEQYVELREALGAMIPRTSFVQTHVDGRPSVIVVVEPVVIERWI